MAGTNTNIRGIPVSTVSVALGADATSVSPKAKAKPKKVQGIPNEEVERLAQRFISSLMSHNLMQARLLAISFTKMHRHGFKIFRVIANDIIRRESMIRQGLRETLGAVYYWTDTVLVKMLLLDKFLNILNYLARNEMIPKQKIITLNSVPATSLCVDSQNFQEAFDSGFVVFGKRFEITKANQGYIAFGVVERAHSRYGLLRDGVLTKLITSFGLNQEYFLDTTKLYLIYLNNLIDNYAFIDANRPDDPELNEQILKLLGDELRWVITMAKRYSEPDSRYPRTDIHKEAGLPEIEYLDKKTSIKSMLNSIDRIQSVMSTIIDRVIEDSGPDEKSIFIPDRNKIYQDDAVTS